MTRKGRPFDCPVSRRDLLKKSALLGLAAVAPSFLYGCDSDGRVGPNHRLSRTRLVMGTYVAITALHPSKDKIEAAVERSFAEIDRLNGILSRHLSSTPLALLNREGSLKHPPPELIHLVKESIVLHDQSSAAFDITVLPLVELFRRSFADGGVPEQYDIEEVLHLIGSQYIEVDEGEIRLGRASMGLTLDGIAKGYVVDRASQILLEEGIENHLINAGGDIKTQGTGEGGKPWTIAIQDPAKGGAYPDIIRLNTGAVATSGNYEIYYDQDKLFHHIVDGRSGQSPQQSKSVSVAASSVTEADALATTVFVLEPLAGVDFINNRPSTSCLIIDHDDRVHKSSSWRNT